MGIRRQRKISCIPIIWVLILASCQVRNTQSPETTPSIRFASYNVALFRSEPGALAKDLRSGEDPQIQNVAAVIQHVRPDILALMEFDYDPSGELLNDFRENYLNISQFDQEPIDYPYQMAIPSNTGVLSNSDYDNDGKIELPNDAYGFGRYEGQYAFAILSKYPLDEKNIRSFQMLNWSSLPEAKRPMNEDGSPYYEDAEWKTFRLSSKNHKDIPVLVSENKSVHVILAHPTPPVFDGPEDKNGLRNFDEIRLLKDYINDAEYLIDDRGQRGGLKDSESFVIMGDLNADPVDGDSYPRAINQLLEDPKVNPSVVQGEWIPRSNGGLAHNQAVGDKGDPGYDTSFFGKRIDYVLPSKDLKVKNSGVFWPAEGESLHEQVKDKRASDHLMVWVEIESIL